jgi:NADH-quinone oxidoreductase subunit G
VQSFHGVVKPLGETRPAWKVLRVLGNLLGLPGFAFESADEVRAEALGDVATIPERLAAPAGPGAKATAPARPAAANALERIADVPIHAADLLVRRSTPLQLTADARPPRVGVPSELAAERGIAEGARVRVTQGSASVVLAAHIDPSLASNVIRVAAGHPLTAALGPMFGRVEIAAEPTAADPGASDDAARSARPAPAH